MEIVDVKIVLLNKKKKAPTARKQLKRPKLAAPVKETANAAHAAVQKQEQTQRKLAE
jgi:hypothetical protein